jgi:DNA-binding MarR family transcriptional regulator
MVVRVGDGFTLTDDGHTLFARLVAQIERFESEQLAGMAKQDLDAARKVLERLYERLKPF